jgi:hypothetical protein
MLRLYRADGGKAGGGLSSWSSSVDHVHEYRAGRFLGFGGQRLRATTVNEKGRDVLDLRSNAHQVMLDAGLVDLHDYEGSLQDVLRDLANLFRAHGYRWVAFRERPEVDYDEWLRIEG